MITVDWRSMLHPLHRLLFPLVALVASCASSAHLSGSSGSGSGGGSSSSASGAAGMDGGGGAMPPGVDGGTGGGGGADAGPAFVKTCGTSLCLGGAPFRIKGATAYGQYDNAPAEVAAAMAAKLNTLEIVEFETKYHDLADTMSDATWKRVDALVAAAGGAGLHVILNLSSYGQSLAAAGQTPTVVDWKPYLQFLTGRVNTITHVLYADDPTIALIEIWGEIPAPDGMGTHGTPQQMTDFFHRTLGELEALDPNHLMSTGGFSYLNETNAAGIDWKTIMSDKADHVCAVEVNSQGDRDTTVPMVSSFCKGLGKPWFLSAWSACVGQSSMFNGDIDHFPTDALAAQHAADMYAVAADKNVGGAAPAMPAVGSDFWNLGNGQAPTCDINPGFPMTFAVVVAAQ
jgi:hypothetical protein